MGRQGGAHQACGQCPAAAAAVSSRLLKPAIPGETSGFSFLKGRSRTGGGALRTMAPHPLPPPLYAMPSALFDFLAQAGTVATLVAGLLVLTRRGGALLAGLATAGLSAPTLALLALHQGADFACLAALGTLLSTPVCAGAAALALRWLARPARRGTHAVPAQAWLAPLLAGLMSATVCLLAPALGPLGSGFVGGLPLVAASTVLGTRAHSGPAAARRYVLAYRHGLGARGVMNFVFAIAALPLGAAWALGLALAASAVMISRGGFRPAFQRAA